jgi:hypothetical protein
MATNKPVKDDARNQAVRKRSQLRTKSTGEMTKRDKTMGQFMDKRRPRRTSLRAFRHEDKAG